MTRRGSIRGFGTVCVGTAFLGFGCTQDNDAPKLVDSQPPEAQPGPAMAEAGQPRQPEREWNSPVWVPSAVRSAPPRVAGPAAIASPRDAQLLTSASTVSLASTALAAATARPALPPVADLPPRADLPPEAGPHAAPAGGQPPLVQVFDAAAARRAAEPLPAEDASLAGVAHARPAPSDPATGTAAEPDAELIGRLPVAAGAASGGTGTTTSPAGLPLTHAAGASTFAENLDPEPAVAGGAVAAPATDGAKRSIAQRQRVSPVPSLAEAMPDRGREPIMASVDVPRPVGPLPPAANDRATNDGAANVTAAPASDAAAAPPARLADALIPARTRTGSIVGSLDGDVAVAPAQSAALGGMQGAGIAAGRGAPEFSYQDELILELQVEGYAATDTIVAYSSQQGIYLPLGTLARILDLAIRVSDEGHYAFGWVLREDRIMRIDLRQGVYEIAGEEAPAPAAFAVAFDGEMYLRAEDLSRFIPIALDTSLRSQSVTIKTLEPFPFEQRLKREADRLRLARAGTREEQSWPRRKTPWLLAGFPSADLQLRAVSRSADGEQIEGDVLVGGDLLYLSAQAFLSANSTDGLVSSLVELGRVDPDGRLLGPLAATEFAVGDVTSPTMPIGLRSVAGRGFSIGNAPLGSVSAFDRIDLRGVLQDGYEVELYRNDILIGSTTERVNGRYEFLQVPVDFGLNVFRLVFYGPQGQRYEEVRSISVGDGRLASGEFVYRIGAVQKDQNLLGVRDPDYIPPQDFGDWRGAAELSYGLSSDLTTVMSAAWFEDGARDRWIASGGVRTGLGRFALRGDVAATDGDAYAFVAGIGGRLGRSAFTVTHTEYSGAFLDETRSVSRELLRRATELDFNTTVSLGGAGRGLVVPITARLSHFETRDGRQRTNAVLRASTRLPGLLTSNTFEYTRFAGAGGGDFSQLIGNFDLATLGGSRTRARASLAYALLPSPDLLSAGVEVDHLLDERTSLRASAGYIFSSRSPQIAASARRDFDRFSLAFDGNYDFGSKSYAVGLRLGLSFGRDPVNGRFFTSRQSLAGSGGASLLAFHDRDADGAFGPGDEPLPEVDFVAFNSTSSTDTAGNARLLGLGHGRPVSIQVDTTSLPDIDMAPATRGFEIVPRAGRMHRAEVPIVSLSEVEGKVALLRDGVRREVSGVRLELRGPDDKPAAFAKTEVDGYYFFERVPPGRYTVAIESDQARRLGICLGDRYVIEVGAQPAVLSTDLVVEPCS